uniref:Uncharacterized protein n=1 Tax=Arundo donax TaxID=35708 RepID=A0A0A8XVP4_ARUDO
MHSNKLDKLRQHLLTAGGRVQKAEARWALDIHHNQNLKKQLEHFARRKCQIKVTYASKQLTTIFGCPDGS